MKAAVFHDVGHIRLVNMVASEEVSPTAIITQDKPLQAGRRLSTHLTSPSPDGSRWSWSLPFN